MLEYPFQVLDSRSTNSKLEMFCVFYVDMESSTHNMAYLCPEKYTSYYMLFYDTLSDIASRFGGRVIKRVGDALIIYFPTTSDPANKTAFKSTLDCAVKMFGARSSINEAFCKENLPPVSYRVSADYGRMEYVETETSLGPDWIGPSMNMVAKMNRIASTNTMVVGGDLHQVLSRFSFEEYSFELAGELNIGIRQKYPIYSVTTKVGYDGGISSMIADVAKPVIRLNKKGTVGNKLPNVVIVDDEQDILLVYKRYLSDQPVNVEVFADPTQLLARLALVGPSYYDLAILDMKMPKMNGFQVYQILAALKPSIKALFVSALDYAGEVLTMLRWIDKEEDFIRKPVSRENFIYAVNRKIKPNVYDI